MSSERKADVAQNLPFPFYLYGMVANFTANSPFKIIIFADPEAVFELPSLILCSNMMCLHLTNWQLIRKLRAGRQNARRVKNMLLKLDFQ